MSEEVRDLERAVSEGGGARERLKLARALERIGRVDEAREALVPARSDADVRRELGRFPAWTHPEADAGATNYLDVEPIRTKPVVKWSKPIRFSPDAALATAFAVVATNRAQSCALDGETGELLWDAGHEAIAIVGDTALLRSPRGVAALDLWSGEQLYELELPFAAIVGADERGLVVHASDRVETFVFEDARRAPTPERSAPFSESDGRVGRILLAGDRIVVGSWRGCVLLARELDPLSRVRGISPALSSRVLVIEGIQGLRSGTDVVAIDPATSQQRWRAEFPAGTFALTPSFVAGRWPHAVVFLDPADGTRKAPDIPFWCEAGAIVRDVLVTWDLRELESPLRAYDVGGRELWRIPLPELPSSPIYAIAAATRQLACAAGRNTVFCLEAPT